MYATPRLRGVRAERCELWVALYCILVLGMLDFELSYLFTFMEGDMATKIRRAWAWLKTEI